MKRKNNPKNNPKKRVKKNTSKKGDDSVNYVIALILAIGCWETKKMTEGTAADVAIRRTRTDLWMPVQVKSCSTGKGEFNNLKGNYKNMIMFLVELTDGVGGNVWIGRRDDFPTTQVGNIYVKSRKKSKHHKTYDAFRVLNPQNLNARIHSLDTDPYIFKKSLAFWNVPGDGKKRKEALSVILFKAVLAGFGHSMQQPEYENTATDWFLNGNSIQDKTAGTIHWKQYHVNLHKSAGIKNGIQQYQPYAKGDNGFYLVFIMDNIHTDAFMTKLSVEQFLELSRTASLRGCYLFSEADLVATGHIATSTQKGKQVIYLPVPNADGSFEDPGPKSHRTHDFKSNYFHKDNFRELLDKILV
jgi:hypothetical protein